MVPTPGARARAGTPVSVPAAVPSSSPVTPSFSWARQAGDVDGYGNFLYALAVDNAGNSLVVGQFFSADAQFFGSSVPTPFPAGWFVAKYDNAGNVLWAQSVGENTILTGAGVDASGNAFVAGTIYGPSSIGPIALNNAGDGALVVAKLDAAGNVLWAKEALGTSYSMGATLGVDSAGSVYASGAFSAAKISFGTVSLRNTGNTGGLPPEDAFVVKYSNNGAPVKAPRVVAVSYENHAYNFGGIGLDAGGNTYVFGSFSGAGSFGNLVPVNNTGTRAYLSKYAPGGALLWVRQITGTGFIYPEGLAVDGAGDTYVERLCHARQHPVRHRPGPQQSPAAATTCSSRRCIDCTTGAAQWVRDAGGASANNSASGVAVDAQGNVYQAGYFDSPTLTLGGTVLNNSSLFGSVYVGKFSAAAQPVVGGTIHLDQRVCHGPQPGGGRRGQRVCGRRTRPGEQRLRERGAEREQRLQYFRHPDRPIAGGFQPGQELAGQ